MRLLNSASYEFQEFLQDLPPYAILSHTWHGGDDEVTFHDMCGSPREVWERKPGWRKIESCCRQAREDGLEFVWVDTCCIDKSSSAELQEAINSMFRWYELSTECYAFLDDIVAPEQQVVCHEDSSTAVVEPRSDDSLPGLKATRWFSRGWTLQELLAPESVRFFDANWHEFGDKVSRRRQVASITGIREDILLNSVLGAREAISTVSTAQRMSWAAKRVTTRVEDMAYCLLGIFDVNMPLLYGEGPKAFQRLQEEIMKISADQSLLAWGLECNIPSVKDVSTALAQSPSDFVGCGDVISRGPQSSGDSFAMTQRGLLLNLPVIASSYDTELIYCVLNCTTSERVSRDGDRPRVLAISMLHPSKASDYGSSSHPDEYYRLSLRVPTWVDEQELEKLPRMKVYLPRFFKHWDVTLSLSTFHLEITTDAPPQDYFIGGVFPPELSANEHMMAGPQVLSPYGDVLVHFASCSPMAPDFVVAIVFKDWTSTFSLEYSPKDRKQQLLCVTSRSPMGTPGQRQKLTYAALGRLVSDIITKETGANHSQLLDNTRKLADLGVDATRNVEIAKCLRKTLGVLHIPNISDPWDGSMTVGDLMKNLRFVTRPSFSLTNIASTESVREIAMVSRLMPTKLKLSLYQVGERDSLPTFLIRKDILWKKLASTDFDGNEKTTAALLGNEVTVSLKLDQGGIQLHIGNLQKPRDVDVIYN